MLLHLHLLIKQARFHKLYKHRHYHTSPNILHEPTLYNFRWYIQSTPLNWHHPHIDQNMQHTHLSRFHDVVLQYLGFHLPLYLIFAAYFSIYQMNCCFFSAHWASFVLLFSVPFALETFCVGVGYTRRSARGDLFAAIVDFCKGVLGSVNL